MMHRSPSKAKESSCLSFVFSFIEFLCSSFWLPYILLKKNPAFNMDLDRWIQRYKIIDDKSRFRKFLNLIARYREFRSLIYYRLKKQGSGCLIVAGVYSFFYKGQTNLYIDCNDVGGGFFIQHGFATIISAEKIGCLVTIRQQTTIGWQNKDGRPVIGNNVSIGAGAKVLGNITIGNNVLIGANAVVVKNVPENTVVAGVPAQIISMDGKKCNIKLGSKIEISALSN